MTRFEFVKTALGEEERPPSTDDQELPWVIALGPTQAGKTVFLTCLYHQGSELDRKYEITVERGEEIIIGNYIRTIERRKWPDPTGRKEVSNIRLTIYRRSELRGALDLLRKKKVVFQIPDYAGQLLTLPKNPAPGILAKVRDGTKLEDEEVLIVNLMSKAKGVILVVDPTLQRAVENSSGYDAHYLQMDYITLINIFKEQGMASRPLLVLVTKWDTVKAELRNGSPQVYLEKTYPRLMRHLRTKWSKRKLACASVWLDNESSVGPISPISPHGYEGVLEWIMKAL